MTYKVIYYCSSDSTRTVYITSNGENLGNTYSLNSIYNNVGILSTEQWIWLVIVAETSTSKLVDVHLFMYLCVLAGVCGCVRTCMRMGVCVCIYKHFVMMFVVLLCIYKLLALTELL